MLITCPSCQAEYNVPGDVPVGRTVKCARCQTRWAPVPVPPPEPEVEPPPPPAPDPPPAVVVPLAPKRGWIARRLKRPTALGLAWVGSGLLVAALIAAAIVWRAPVMHVWPPSARVYALLRLH